jgi:threonine dehydrogenase-like Zn-dependent dehydrogenase
MRAAVLHEGRVVVRETRDPVPGPGELLVRTRSTAICASDVHFMDHPEAIEGDPRYLYDPARDIVMGHEFVGEVVGHGPGCTDEHPDAPGSFGELFLVTERMARAVPDGVSDDAVALVDPFAVGEYYVRTSSISPDEVAIVLGAGAIGLSAVAALKLRGITSIIVSDYNAERRALAATFGATDLVDPKERTPFDAYRTVNEARGLKHPPVVIECVGASGLLQSVIDECPYRTRIYAAGGHYTGDSISVTAASQKGVLVQFAGGPEMVDWYGTLDAVCEGRLDPTPAIGEVISLDDLPDRLGLTRRSEGPPRIIVHPSA